MAHLSIGQKYMVATSVLNRFRSSHGHMKKLSMDSSYNVGPPSDVSWFKQSYWGL